MHFTSIALLLAITTEYVAGIGTNMYLLYRQECFSGKKTTRKVHTKLHPEHEWRILRIYR